MDTQKIRESLEELKPEMETNENAKIEKDEKQQPAKKQTKPATDNKKRKRVFLIFKRQQIIRLVKARAFDRTFENDRL